jgi:hypothetical protein
MEWMGWVNNSGYGCMKTDERPHRQTTAHRIAYMLHYGKIPEGMEVMHSCDNRRCVNWEHLSLGTHQDNMADIKRKDRFRRSKFSENDLKEIRLMRAKGMTQSEIAKHYGVSRPQISLLLTGVISRLST